MSLCCSQCGKDMNTNASRALLSDDRCDQCKNEKTREDYMEEEVPCRKCGTYIKRANSWGTVGNNTKGTVLCCSCASCNSHSSNTI